MKYIILFITIFSICLPKFWISYDLNWNIEVSAGGVSGDEDVDTGAIGLGYEDLVSDNVMLGISYDAAGATDDDADVEFQMVNLYTKYLIPVNEATSLWGTLGYNVATGDFDELDGGLSYGFGMTHESGVGVYYTFHNFEYSQDNYYYSASEDYTVTRMGIFYSF